VEVPWRVGLLEAAKYCQGTFSGIVRAPPQKMNNTYIKKKKQNLFSTERYAWMAGV